MGNKDIPIAPYVTELYASYFFPFHSVIQMSKAYGLLSTFFFSKKIFQFVASNLSLNNCVLQTGVVGADFEKTIFEKVGENTDYTIADISQTRLELCADALGFHEKLHIEKKDIRTPLSKKYDAALCIFVLHEMPDKSKKIVIQNILDALNDNGKAIFVDYHRPATFNLLRYPVRLFSRLFEPFAENLFNKPFQFFIPNNDLYTWKKQTFCGGLYQCVIVKRKKVRPR